MHGLDIIIARNAEQAGREMGFAVNDHDHALAQRIYDAHEAAGFQGWLEFTEAYFTARDSEQKGNN